MEMMVSQEQGLEEFRGKGMEKAEYKWVRYQWMSSVVPSRNSRKIRRGRITPWYSRHTARNPMYSPSMVSWHVGNIN
eukprot:832113-Amorphochlora_amoeboformis.AAC.2